MMLQTIGTIIGFMGLLWFLWDGRAKAPGVMLWFGLFVFAIGWMLS